MDDNRKDIYNKLFFYFEENDFQNKGNWNRTLNSIFEFSEWVDKLEDEDFIHLTGLTDVKECKAEIQSGIDKWLVENHKNLFY